MRGVPLITGGLFCAESRPNEKESLSSSLHALVVTSRTPSASAFRPVVNCIVLSFVMVQTQRAECSASCVAHQTAGKSCAGVNRRTGTVRCAGSRPCVPATPLSLALYAGTGGFASPPCDGFALGASG